MEWNPAVTEFFAYPIDKLVAGESYVTGTTFDLTNDVHPLFARHNMHGFDYEAILPALRLASYFLSTECLLGYWWGVLWNDLWTDENPDCMCKVEHGKHIYQKLPDRPLTAREVAHVKFNLRNLASIVHFYKEDVNACGCCRQREGNLRTGVTEHIDGFNGKASDIIIGNGIYGKLLYQLKLSEGELQGIPDELWRRYLELAVSLTHELAHAAANARWGPHHAVPIGDRKMAEQGFDWEDWVFGGLLQINWLGATTTLEEWPSGAIYESYLAKYGAANGLHFCGKVVEPLARIWRVPDSWIRQLFQTAFWENVVPWKGIGALRPPKLLGYRKQCHDCECSVCQKVEPASDAGQHDEACNSVASGDEVCYAGAVILLPPHPDVEPGLDRGVPKGYVMLADGTIVAESLQKAFQSAPRAAPAKKGSSAPPKKTSKKKPKAKRKKRS